MQNFNVQVGGHQNILQDEDKAIIFKPALPTEKDFYEQSLNFPTILPYLPNFMGILHPRPNVNLEDIEKQEVNLKELKHTKSKGDDGTFICLENLLSGYKQPNVLDLKIGTILADHLATEEKKERMRKRAQETTSFEMGIRVTGMKVYNNATKEYRDYDREYGVNLTKDTMINAFKEFFPKEIDTELRNCIIQGFISEITDLTGILKTLPISMAASSLLFVYEGDNKELRKKIEEYQLDYNSEDEDNEEEEEEQEQIPPFRLRLIDFAHSFWLPPKHELDKGCFLGLKNTVDFLGKLVEESN